MHDEPSAPVGSRRSAAVEKVDGFFTSIPGAGRLPARDLDRYHNRGYGLGWRVFVDFSDGNCRELHILADGDFPYTPPRIVVADGPDILAWPHLETDGFLCILPADAAVSSENPASVAEKTLGEACRLIEESINGRNVEDFRQEFLSYWQLTIDKSSPNCISLLEPQGPGRRVSVWRGKQAWVVGESPEALRRWLPRWGAKKGKDGDYKLCDGVLLWLPVPLVPAEYPRTAADLRVLAQKKSPEIVDELERLAVSGADEINIVLGAPTLNGVCFAAMTTRPPRQAGAPKRKGNSLVKGFRPGHVPRDLLVDRYLSGTAKVTKVTAQRADHLWIHGRDQDPQQNRLREARVAILGCGSVGGPLARLMAQAGIGNLLLVDPDTMDWPNLSRHELGADSVSRFKAPELVKMIEKAYPHLGEVNWRRDRVGPDAQKLTGELASYDLIVSTMGNWAAESFLSDVQQETDGFPPVLYGWVEPNAVAAHALLIPRGGACLRCGMNDTGRPHLTVSDWSNGGDSLQAPACGALFTPYGPTELCWANALLSEAVIDALMGEMSAACHRIWIGPRSRIEAAGGAWAPNWIAEMGDPSAGGMTMKRQWPASASCLVCARRGYAA